MMEDNFSIPSQILNDLCSRFIINVPEEERSDLIRIFFQIEIAHWFYLDFFCTENPDLKPVSIRDFAENIFRHCPFLMQHLNHVDDILSKWKVFKHAVPTNGAIILDETMKYVLLVQGFWAKASWGFPKGKVIEEETEMKCAIREVLEETGFDITPQIKPDQYLQIQINEQVIRLYIVTNVSRNTKFEPRTRREIKEVRWFAIEELPTHKKDLRSKQSLGFSPNAFFMVIPFVKALKQWIAQQTNGSSSRYIKNYSESGNGGYVNVNTSLLSTNLTPTNTYPLHSSATYPQLQQNSTKKSPTNTSNTKDSNNNSLKDELRRQKQQTQYYNKLNKDEYNELLSCKDTTSTNALTKSNPKYQKYKENISLNTHSNSRFKSINKTNNKNNVTTAASTLSTSTITSSNTPGILNVSRKNQPTSTSSATSSSITTTTTAVLPKENFMKAKKQLDFYGPEDWINFKFNHQLLISDLPCHYE